jgi:Fe-S cluster assembly protein SufD
MSIQVSSELIANRNAASSRLVSLKRFLTDRLAFDSELATGAQERLEDIRDRAFHLLADQILPTTREEEWRFTDISAIRETEFKPEQNIESDFEAIEPLLFPESDHFMVFTNGKWDVSSNDDLPPGLFMGDLNTALSQTALTPNPPLQRLYNCLGTQPGSEERFTLLNTAGFNDAAVIWVAKNTVIEQPIHLLFVSVAGDTPLLAQPRCLVVAEPNSQVTIVEEYLSIGEGESFTNSVTEIWLGENAAVNHTRIQQEHPTTAHIGKTAVSQSRDSRYTCNAISLGAKLSRHNLEIYQTGEQTQTTLNGLTMIADEQVSDTHSSIALTKPYATSRQLHKCIVDARAHAIFNGKVSVPRTAQLTDAGQLNRNLLLSPKARVDTKPQLEIVADNVKCTHGATVGQLDTNEVFYLQSRGIEAASARRLLVHAFAQEIIDQVPIESLRQRLSEEVGRRDEG